MEKTAKKKISKRTPLSKTILATTDFSPSSINAIHYAADMASALKAELVIMNVCPLVVSYSDVPEAVNIQQVMKASEKELLRIRRKLSLEKKGELPIKIEESAGLFFRELVDACQRIQPYAVVLGSQGKTAAERVLFGSQALYAMKHLTWPLIAVPIGATFSSIRKIGLACDLRKVSETIPVEEIKTLVKDFNAELHVLNVDTMERFDPDLVYESGTLQFLLSDLKPELHFITSDDVDEGIADFVERASIDLLVMIPKRHDLLEKLLHRSHTKQLILHCHVPLLALHV